jgi:hypothetical protein
LRPRRFWLLWSASTATNLGDGIRLVALPLLASTATTDVREIVSVTVATFAPLLLFGPFAGVLIDRTDRRNAIAVAHLDRAVLLLGLAALIAAGHATLGCIVVVAVLYGIGEAVADPASQAYLPQLIPADQLAATNSRLMAGQIIGDQFVGRALGEALFALSQLLPFTANAAVWSWPGCCCSPCPPRGPPPPSPQPQTRQPRAPAAAAPAAGPVRWVLREIDEGATTLVSFPLLRGLTIIIALWGLAAGTFWDIGVVYALDDLHAGDAGFGIMVSLSAVGSLLGAGLTQPLVKRIGIFATMLATITLSAAAVAAMSIAGHVLVAAGLLALNSVALACRIILVITIRQTVVPAHLLGRVSAADRMLYALSFPTAAALAGLLASAIGTRLTLLVSAVPILLAALLLPSIRQPLTEAWARARPHAEPAAPVAG